MSLQQQRTICPKCSYQRAERENAPDWACPSCGIAYAKFGSEPEFREDTFCPKCHYKRAPTDPYPRWRCPGCGVAYSKLGIEPEYPADAFCANCYYTRQPEDESPHWRCPACDLPYAGEIEIGDEDQPSPPVKKSRAPEVNMPKATPAINPAPLLSQGGPGVSAPSLLHYFLRMMLAFVFGAGCILAITRVDCSAIVGVWLACIFMIRQHYRLKKRTAEFELRANAEWLQARHRSATLPAALELVILLLVALIFASGNYLYSNRCIESGAPAYTAQTESFPLLMPGLNGSA